MDIPNQDRFSGPVTVFQERRLPVAATPTGYAALIDAYALRVPLPRILSASGSRHRNIHQDGWRIYSPRYAPKPSLEGHLTFALKHEGLDLAVLRHLFAATGPAPVEDLVRAKPTGAYARRVWFLYEWLTGRRLDLPDADRASYATTLGTRAARDRRGGTPSILDDACHDVQLDAPETVIRAVADVVATVRDDSPIWTPRP